MGENVNTLRVLDISPLTIHNGPGNRTLLHLKGCPLRCKWCSSPESQSSEQQFAYNDKMCYGCGHCVSSCDQGAISMQESPDSKTAKAVIDWEKCNNCFQCISKCNGKAFKIYGEDMPVDSIVSKLLRNKHYYDNSGGGVTISGGEPLMEVTPALLDLLLKLKEAGIHIGFDTAGYIPRKHLAKTIPYTDFYLWDIKELDARKHKELTGVENSLILDNLLYVANEGVPVYIRYPVITGMNDAWESWEKLCDLADEVTTLVEINLMPLHHLGYSRYEYIGRGYPLDVTVKASSEYMEKVKKYIESRGFNCKIVG